MSHGWAAAGLLVLLCGGIAGIPAAHGQAPALDVADLPPLPAVDEPLSSKATVLAASDAEAEVVVGAAKREQSLGSVASAVTVITGDRLRRFGYRTVGEAVAATAGVYLADNRLSYSIGIRGLQIPGDFNTRVLVLVDGATVNEAWGSFAGVGFDAIVAVDDIARIEVIRGPVSSLYGTNAFFGIINIVTRGATEAPRAWARTAVNQVHGITAGGGLTAGGVSRQVRGSVHMMSRFGDTTTLPELPGVALTGDGARAVSGGLVAVYDRSFAQLRGYRYDRESPFAPYDVNPAGPHYEQRNTQVLLEGGHSYQPAERLALTGRLSASYYRFSDRAPAFDPSMAALDTSGTAQVIGGELRGRYAILAPDRLGVTVGAEASYNRTRSTAGPPEAPRAKANDTFDYDVEGVYAELDAQPVPWLGFTGGVRYDRHSVRPDSLSPRAALFLALPDDPERYGMKLLYAEGFRNASAFESQFDDGSDFQANSEIAPEQITSFELVAWARPVPGLLLRLSGFAWQVSDVIEQQPIAVEDTIQLQFQNVAQFVSRGVEAEASYRDRRGWYGFAGIALARVGFATGDEPITFGGIAAAPALTASAGISTPRLFDRVHVSSEVIALGARATRPAASGAASPRSPPWLGWNAALHAPRLGGFDVTAGVRNLLGTRDQVPAPGDYDRSLPAAVVVPRVPAEGREIYVKVGYSY